MRRFHIVLVSFLLAACGGGGGATTSPTTPTPPNPAPTTLNGTYHVVSFATPVLPASQVRSAWGTGVADGTGNFTFTGSVNSLGATNGLTYTLEAKLGADGALELADPVTGNAVFRGGRAADEHVCVLSSVGTPSDPSLLVLVRTSVSATPALFAGDYWAAEFGALLGYTSRFGIEAADGVALAQGLVSGNAVGNIITPPVATNWAFTVGPVGESGLLDVGVGFSGGITEDGAFGVWGGNTVAGGPPFIRAMVRGASTVTAADFSGTYHIASIEYDLLASGPISTYGTATSDGVSAVTFDLTVNDGAANSPASAAASYSFNAGLMTLNRLGLTEDLTGTVSPDGRYVVLGGGLQTNSNPALIVMVRK